MNKLSCFASARVFVLPTVVGILVAGTVQAQPMPSVAKEVIVRTLATPITAQPGPPTHPKAVGKAPATSPAERATLRLDHVPVAAIVVSANHPPRAVELVSTPLRLTPGELLVTKSSERAIFSPVI